MSVTTEFRLPDVGEGLTEAEIVVWHVGVGDPVAINDLLCDIETAKSVVELPSPVAGTVTALHVGTGDTHEVGTVIVSIADGAGSEARTPTPEPEPVAPDVVKDVVGGVEEDGEEERPLVLVGTGPTAAPDRRRRLGPRQPAPVGRAPVAAEPGTGRARAKPPVRLLARRLGVDLASLDRGDGSVVTREAVTAAAEGATSTPVSSTATSPARAHDPEQRETRTPIKGVRKHTAAAMTASAFTAPHVTEWLSVDVTPTMELVARLRADRQWAGVRVNPMLMVARAFLLAVRKYPAVNTRWDDEAQEIVQHHYVNLGIAAATPRGLIVPNIKDAHALDLAGLAEAMAELVETARAGRTSPAQMSHGTLTITNIGALGVDAGTPILNPGEAAILAFGSIRQMPWVVDGEIVARHVTQLAMSFDHRLVDGELGSHVLAETGALLADPARAMTVV